MGVGRFTTIGCVFLSSYNLYYSNHDVISQDGGLGPAAE